MRELDRRTIEDFGTPGEELMVRAGRGVAEAARDLLAACGGVSALMIAGTGNNGGDVFAAAAELSQTEFDIEVWICGSRGKISGDAKRHLDRMIRAGILPKELHSENDFIPKANPDLIVDGLLGTGSRGAPRGLMSPLIDWINREAQFARVLSIDIPSGIDADSGTAEGSAVQADRTVTMGLPKTGLIRPAALAYIGRLDVVEIGIPPAYIADTAGCAEAEMIDYSDLRFPRRPRDSHKGHFGHVLLIGGSRGMAGSIALAARAALRSGAGLVSVLTPEAVVPLVAQAAGPEAMVYGFPAAGERGSLSELWNVLSAADQPVSRVWKKATAVCAGPGLGQDPHLMERLAGACSVPLVLDADALCISPAALAAAQGPVILTPHPGEFERLFGAPVTDRWAQAQAAAEQTGQTVVLKGAGTVVAQAGRKLAVNLTGNPGMATGGSGDVLAGLIAGLAAQGVDSFDAARTGVYLHGLAADLAAYALTQPGLLPGDLIEALPDALRMLGAR